MSTNYSGFMKLSRSPLRVIKRGEFGRTSLMEGVDTFDDNRRTVCHERLIVFGLMHKSRKQRQ